jgi:hypothetical protein
MVQVFDYIVIAYITLRNFTEINFEKNLYMLNAAVKEILLELGFSLDQFSKNYYVK